MGINHEGLKGAINHLLQNIFTITKHLPVSHIRMSTLTKRVPLVAHAALIMLLVGLSFTSSALSARILSSVKEHKITGRFSYAKPVSICRLLQPLQPLDHCDNSLTSNSPSSSQPATFTLCLNLTFSLFTQ